MEHLLTIENLQKFNPSEFIEADNMKGYYYSPNGSRNALRKYHVPNIEVMTLITQSNQIIDPLTWLTKFEDVVKVDYAKYLELMEFKANRNGNKKMLDTIESYKRQIS